MTSFAPLFDPTSTGAWLFIPSAIILGALHGLEPGHSKTMMAAFIVAIRGTVAQAVMLGLAATLSHTLIVWIVALGGMYLWRDIAPETFEPWLQLLSGVLIVAMALWMLWRVREDKRRAALAAGAHGPSHAHHHPHAHPHLHAHPHPHADAHGDTGAHGGHGTARRIDTGHGIVSVEIAEDGVPPRWELRTESGHAWRATEVTITTERLDGTTQIFAFAEHSGILRSVDVIPEPHEFMARVSLGHAGHSHNYDLAFVEEAAAAHDHVHEELRGLSVATAGYQDAHQLAHANDIRRRFADRDVTNLQIVLFGLTGGLIPCPAAITVLLLCLQLKEIALGAALVFAFSIGLALTLVVVGGVAAWSVTHATRRSSWFAGLAQRAPYLSGVLIVAVGVYVGALGWRGIAAQSQMPPVVTGMAMPR